MYSTLTRKRQRKLHIKNYCTARAWTHLMRVSMGVLPTSLTKKSCSMTVEDTVRSDGRRRSSLPNLVGWFGYCVRQYSSRAH